MRLKQLLLINSLLLGAFLFTNFTIFCIMWQKDAVYVFEDILWVRLLETILALLLSLVGFGSFFYTAIHWRDT